jgi:hypothetical protein
LHFPPHFVKRQRQRARLLVFLPRSLLALRSAVPGMLADGAALELRRLLPTVGAPGLDLQSLDRRSHRSRHLLVPQRVNEEKTIFATDKIWAKSWDFEKDLKGCPTRLSRAFLRTLSTEGRGVRRMMHTCARHAAWPLALGDCANSALEDSRFTLPAIAKSDVYNLRSPDLGSKSTFGVSASEHNLSHLPGLVGDPHRL